MSRSTAGKEGILGVGLEGNGLWVVGVMLLGVWRGVNYSKILCA